MIWSEVKGSGTVVVLLHGFTHNADAWRPVASRLAQSYSTIAIDIRGHGRTGLTQGEPTPDGVADDVMQVLNKEGVNRAILWGYSMGARLALHTFLRHIQRFDGLIFESGNPGIEDPAQLALRAASDAKLADAIESHPIAEFIKWWEVTPIFAGQSQGLIHRQRVYRLENDPVALAAALRGIGPAAVPSMWGQVGGITVPTLALTGERDLSYGSIAERMKTLTPAVKHKVIPAVGHSVSLENPDETIRVVQSFIRSTGV